MNVFEQFLVVLQKATEFITSAAAGQAAYTALAAFLEFIRKLVAGNIA